MSCPVLVHHTNLADRKAIEVHVAKIGGCRVLKPELDYSISTRIYIGSEDANGCWFCFGTRFTTSVASLAHVRITVVPVCKEHPCAGASMGIP